MKKIMYGVTDFALMRRENAYFVDRTGIIRELEKTRYAMFLRPRRFGKSLWCSILQAYYDIGAARAIVGEQTCHAKFNALTTHLADSGLKLYVVIDGRPAPRRHRLPRRQHGALRGGRAAGEELKCQIGRLNLPNKSVGMKPNNDNTTKGTLK